MLPSNAKGDNMNISPKKGTLCSALILLALVTVGVAEPYWIYMRDKGPNRCTALVNATSVATSRRLSSPMHAVSTIEDVPLHPRYLRMIEVAGFVIRARSRWLNAVSVESPPRPPQSLPQSLPQPSSHPSTLLELPFVMSVEPVAVEREQVQENKALLIQRKEPIDSTFFGSTYRQLELLNVPAVHNLGVFGKGAVIGFLDTGLKRDHPVFNTLALSGEHDFITGDEIVLYDVGSGDTSSIVSSYEMVMQPEIQGARLYFIADSTFENGTTARVLYMSQRSGDVWIAPKALSQPTLTYNDGIARSFAVSGHDEQLVVWEKGGGDAATVNTRDLVWGQVNASGDFTKGTGALDNFSRNPYFASSGEEGEEGDTNWLFYVKDDSRIYVKEGIKEGTSVSWGASQEIVSAPDAVFDVPRASILGDTLLVAVLDLASGKLYLVRSTDRGASFTDLESVTTAEVVAFDFDKNRLMTAEVAASGAFRLHSYETSNSGTSWSGFLHPDSFAVIDRVDIMSVNGGGVHAVFESAGQVYLTSSPGNVSTWSVPSSLSADFSYQVQLSASDADGEPEIIWSLRGDANTDYDESEDGKDSNEFSHPAHGSRVAALAVGYDAKNYVGSAPGAAIYVAKTEKHVNRYGANYELRVEEDMWVEGLEWLERQGVDIVNSSLGYGEWYDYSERDGKHSPAARAATMAAERGVLVTSSAGNVTSGNPYILPPADAEGILTVGGVDTLGNWWEFTSSSAGSAIGPTPDGRRKPELAAPGRGVYVINVDDPISRYFYGQGTSYAAPLVAGCAALMLEVHPEYRGNPDTLIKLLEQSATLATSPNDTLGFGIPDVYAAIQPIPASLDSFARNELLPPYPNPYHPGTEPRIWFPFRMNKGSSRVFMRIYTLNGELVSELPIEPLVTNEVGTVGVGRYEEPSDLQTMGAYWNGLTSGSGKPASSGLYLVVLHTEFGTHAAKFALLR